MIGTVVDSSEAEHSAPANVEMRVRRILIVENDALQAEELRLTLADSGFEVIGVAGTTVDAVRLAVSGQPDLALVDVKLNGEIDGITAARHLAEQCGVRIVFLSGYIDQAVQQARDFAHGFLNKPYSAADLCSVIEDALRR